MRSRGRSGTHRRGSLVPPISWTEAQPELVEREQQAMAAVAPELVWRDDLDWPNGHRAFGWTGAVPIWTPDRPPPAGLEKLLGGAHLELQVCYPEAFPAVPPSLYPISPIVPFDRRTRHDWHMNGNGSICLTRHALDWSLSDTAADLVAKAAGWFVEYRLLEEELINAMSECGIYTDDSFDELIVGSA